MQFVSISPSETLKSLNDKYGVPAVKDILSANSLKWAPNIGQQFKSMCESAISSSGSVLADQKVKILNSFVQDDDVFEKAALSSSSDWKVLSSMNTFPGYLKVPESLFLSTSDSILGSNNPVSDLVLRQTVDMIQKAPHIVDPSIFSKFSYSSGLKENINTSLSKRDRTSSGAMKFFRLPWGEITLHSSISDESREFPCYPKELTDGRSANYTQMPDMLYQYEPWQLYQSSGPRTCTYTFDMHRDMWTGDHSDGLANDLIRFCEANCYPEFNGSLVNTAICTLYIHGRPLIRGILTNVDTSWDGEAPIGNDGWYLHFTLQLTFTEISKEPLSYSTVKNKPLIG